MSHWILSVLSPWCQVASGVCVCVWIDMGLSKQAIFWGTETVHTSKCIFRKDHYRTQFVGHHICCLRVRMLFTCWSRALSGLCWERLFFFLLLHLATLWCKWKKRSFDEENRFDRSSVCCFFFFLSNGTFNATSHELFMWVTCSKIERGGTRTFWWNKNKTLWRTFITSFTHHAKDLLFFWIKHATDLSIINNWMKWNKICCFKCTAF